MPLDTILGLALSDDSIELNDKATYVFGLMSLESDAETLLFSKALSSPHKYLIDNFVQPYIDIVG